MITKGNSPVETEIEKKCQVFGKISKIWILLMRLRDHSCCLAPAHLCMEAGHEANGHSY